MYSRNGQVWQGFDNVMTDTRVVQRLILRNTFHIILFLCIRLPKQHPYLRTDRPIYHLTALFTLAAINGVASAVTCVTTS